MLVRQLRPEGKDAAEVALRRAYRHLLDRGGVEPLRQEVAWEALRDAVETSDALPDEEKRWLSSGTRSGGWAMAGMTRKEAIEVEIERAMSGHMPGDAMRGRSSASDVDTAMEVLDWFMAVDDDEHPRLRSATLALARGQRPYDVCITYRKRFKGKNKAALDLVDDIRQLASGIICRWLEQNGVRIP